MNEKRKDEIVRNYEFLKKEQGELIERLNQNWVQQERIRKEYKSLSGKDL